MPLPATGRPVIITMSRMLTSLEMLVASARFVQCGLQLGRSLINSLNYPCEPLFEALLRPRLQHALLISLRCPDGQPNIYTDILDGSGHATIYLPHSDRCMSLSRIKEHCFLLQKQAFAEAYLSSSGFRLSRCCACSDLREAHL